jgi:hypothetical protein
MKLLMIVGFANDIFIYNMAKWLKANMDITIDIIEYNDSTRGTQNFGYEYYDNVITMPQNFFLQHIPIVRNYTIDWDKCRQLKNILGDKHYDIIQCHYVLGLYANASYLKDHCNKMYFTFWGGDRNSKYLGSKKIFKYKFRKILLDSSIGIIGGSILTIDKWSYKGKEPVVFRGSFGSVPLEKLYQLSESESKKVSKEYWGMPADKYCVQLGYSGKEIHQYLEIISKLKKYDSYKSKLHLVAPMTRDRNKKYVDKVERALCESGYTYTLIRDRFLSDSEVARLRNSIDIVLQLASRDGYSRSIIEGLCAGSLVVYGSWLEYDRKFAIDGYEGVSVSSIEDACQQLQSIIADFHKYDEITMKNRQIGRTRHLWSERIKDWVAVYSGTAEPITK